MSEVLTDRYAARNRKYDDIEKLRNREHEVFVPPAYRKTSQQIKSPIVDDLIQRATSDLTANAPLINVPVIGTSRKAQENSSLREQWTNSVWKTLDVAPSPNRVSRQLMDNCAQFGQAVPKLIYRPDNYRDYYEEASEGQRGDETLSEFEDRLQGMQLERLPFVWQATDPRSFYPVYQDDVLTEVMEISYRPTVELLRRYEASRDDEGRIVGPFAQRFVSETDLPGPLTRFIEHWDENWVTYWAGGELLKKIEHGYGQVPYFPFYGITTGSRRPEHAARGVADRLMGLVEALDSLLTMNLNWAFIGAFPMGMVERPENGRLPLGDDGQPEEPFLWTPGEIQQLYPGEKMMWMGAPDVGPALTQMMRVLMDLCHEYGLPPLGKGQGSGDEVGYAVNQLLTVIKGIYNPIAQNYAVSMEQETKFLWWMVKHKLQHSVSVWGDSANQARSKVREILTIGPRDISHYNVVVTITPEFHTNQIAVQQASLQQQQAGAISMRTHRENALMIQDPEAEEDQVWVEESLRDPAIRQFLMQQAMKKAGLVEELQKQQAEQIMAEQQAAQAAMGGGMPPEDPMAGMMGAMPPGMPPGAGGNLAPIPGAGQPVAQEPGLGMGMGAAQSMAQMGMPSAANLNDPMGLPGTMPAAP